MKAPTFSHISLGEIGKRNCLAPASNSRKTKITHRNALRFIYRDYLQIAAFDLTRTNQPALWFITWDPTQPVATRPLAIRTANTWYLYGWDLTKNITELYTPTAQLDTDYVYTPYGLVRTAGNITQPIQWSSEFADPETALIYYNFRYYNPLDGRWTRRDPIGIKGGVNVYKYINNRLTGAYDILGLCMPGYEVCRAKCHNVKKCVSKGILTYKATCRCEAPSYPLTPSMFVMDVEFTYAYDVSGENGPMACCCKIRDNDGEEEWNWEPSPGVIGVVLVVGIGIVIIVSAGAASPAAVGAGALLAL